MAETPVIGRRGQVYVGKEDSFGVPPSPLLSTHALRHTNVKLNSNPFNREWSPEKKQTAGQTTRFDRKETADGLIEGFIRPSGTLNTLPEAEDILDAVFGAVASNITLSTTFAPKAPTCALLPAEAGLVENGAHSYKVGFRDAGGITKLSAASTPITTDAGHGKVTVTVPVGPTGTVSRDIYRTAANADPAVAANFKLVAAATINNNTTLTYVDNIADAALSTVAHTSDTSTLLSTTGGFVASATGLAVKQGILIARGGVKYVRFLTTVSTTNLAWAPALPTAVVGDEVVKGCVTYKPYTPTAAPYAISLFAAHYLTADTTRSKMLKGLVLSKLTEQFEQGKEGTFAESGPAKTRTVATAKPAAATVRPPTA